MTFSFYIKPKNSSHDHRLNIYTIDTDLSIITFKICNNTYKSLIIGEKTIFEKYACS